MLNDSNLILHVHIADLLEAANQRVSSSSEESDTDEGIQAIISYIYVEQLAALHYPISISYITCTRDLLDLLISSCLLYTSPSPRDATLSRMPSSA